jgi:hypothetical protein
MGSVFGPIFGEYLSDGGDDDNIVDSDIVDADNCMYDIFIFDCLID